MPHDFEIAVANEQSQHIVNEQQLCDAVQAVLCDSQFDSARISIAVVDDATIHQLNRQFLEHDWPTDVLSFMLERQSGHLEGEIILSADTAAIAAVEAGWPASAEQLLYVIHGALHLIGYADKTLAESQQMRAAEAAYLRRFGCEPVHAARGVGELKVAVGKRQHGGATAR